MIYIRRREDRTKNSSHPLLRSGDSVCSFFQHVSPPLCCRTTDSAVLLSWSSLSFLSLSFPTRRRASSSTLQIFPSFRNFIHFSCQRILQLSVCLWKCRVVRPRRQFSLLLLSRRDPTRSRQNLSVYISRPTPTAQPV